MKLDEIFSALEEVAPVALSDEFCKKYNLYDNSGIIIRSGNIVDGALFSLDLSQKAVNKAKALGYNLIVTHHPAIYGGVSRIDVTAGATAALADCIKSGISVISMHLNFDAAPEGIDYHLMRGLGGNGEKILSPVAGGGYGRVYDIAPVAFKEYIQKINAEFSTERTVGFGGDKKIKRVASFCGAGCDDKAMAFAIAEKADAFISSDLKHHEIAYLLGQGVNVISLTHYAAESYGFNKIYCKIKQRLQLPGEFFTDGDLI